MAPLMTRRALMLGSAGMTLALAAGLSRPAKARDTISLDDFLKVSARLTDQDAADLDSDAAATILQGHARGIIPAILQAPQSIQKDGAGLPFSDVAYNAAHEGIPVIFNSRRGCCPGQSGRVDPVTFFRGRVSGI